METPLLRWYIGRCSGDKHCAVRYGVPLAKRGRDGQVYETGYGCTAFIDDHYCVKHRRRFQFRQVHGTHNPDKVCDGRCMGARGPNCDCACGGANHGKNYG